MVDRVLVLENAQTVRDYVSRRLREEGYEVVAVRSLAEAYRKIREMWFRVVVIDLDLGRSDDREGLDLVPWLEEHYPSDCTRAVVFSKHTDFPDVVRALDTYRRVVVGYVEKEDGWEGELKLKLKEALTAPIDAKKAVAAKVARFDATFPKQLLRELVGHMNPTLKEPMGAQYLSEMVRTLIPGVPEDPYMPLATNIVGPDLMGSPPLTVRMICWSRATQTAIAIYIYGGQDPKAMITACEGLPSAWKPEFLKRHEYCFFYGRSYALRGVSFDQFSKWVE